MTTDENVLRPKVEKLEDMVDYREGSVVSRTLIKKDKGTVTLFAFDENGALSEHTAPFDALLLIVDGEAEVTIDKTNYTMKSGENIILPANRPHAVKALTSFKMLLTMIRA